MVGAAIEPVKRVDAAKAAKMEDAIPSIVVQLWDVSIEEQRKMKDLFLIIYGLLSNHFPGNFKSH
jgi:hypothetical protein